MSDVNTLKTIADLQTVAVDAVKLAKDAKNRAFFALVGDLATTASAAEQLAVDAPSALPELTTLDAQAAADIAKASFGLVVAVLAALKS